MMLGLKMKFEAQTVIDLLLFLELMERKLLEQLNG
jgi:hypothetical protein